MDCRTEWHDTDRTVKYLLPKCLSEKKTNKPTCSETMEGKYISNMLIQMCKFYNCNVFSETINTDSQFCLQPLWALSLRRETLLRKIPQL